MTIRWIKLNFVRKLSRFRLDAEGTVLVEMAIVLPIFLLLLLGLIDFGRMGGEFVMADKAMQRAVRIAAVRPAVCPALPTVNLRGAGAGATTHYGTSCAAGANFCVNPGIVTCTASASNATAAEIWTAIAPLMPSHATVEQSQAQLQLRCQPWLSGRALCACGDRRDPEPRFSIRHTAQCVGSSCRSARWQRTRCDAAVP